jgi:hypothetical protein
MQINFNEYDNCEIDSLLEKGINVPNELDDGDRASNTCCCGETCATLCLIFLLIIFFILGSILFGSIIGFTKGNYFNNNNFIHFYIKSIEI